MWDRDVVLGTAEVTILVAMKNRWGSISTLLPHDRMAVNLDVREHYTNSNTHICNTQVCTTTLRTTAAMKLIAFTIALRDTMS